MQAKGQVNEPKGYSRYNPQYQNIDNWPASTGEVALGPAAEASFGWVMQIALLRPSSQVALALSSFAYAFIVQQDNRVKEEFFKCQFNLTLTQDSVLGR